MQVSVIGRGCVLAHCNEDGVTSWAVEPFTGARMSVSGNIEILLLVLQCSSCNILPHQEQVCRDFIRFFCRASPGFIFSLLLYSAQRSEFCTLDS